MTEELEQHYLKTLPLFVSIPRSGCNWIQAVMELTFDRHRALKNPNTPTWMETEFENPLWMHTHDNFNHQDNPIGEKTVFLYRDPVDVIYSLLKLQKIPANSTSIESFCQRYNRCVGKWLNKDHFGKVFALTYENFKEHPLEELKALSRWYGIEWNEERAKKALKITGDKKTTNEKNGDHPAFKNKESGTEPYELGREDFRRQWDKFIRDRIRIPCSNSEHCHYHV